VHFPFLPEQANGKTPLPPSMSFELMQKGLNCIIAFFG
jgi:pyrrolidone-carboxylate peptidase